MKFLEQLKQAWLLKIIKVVVEQVPVLSTVFKFLDGYKALIGRILMFISAILIFLGDQLPVVFPELLGSYPNLMGNIEWIIGGIGYILTELGLQHKAAKELASEGVVKEIEL